MIEESNPAQQSRVYTLLRGKYAEWMLSLVALLESWFMPVLIEPFMILPILAHPARWFRVCTLVTIASVIGGVLGYLTGMFFFELIGSKLIALYGVEGYLEETTKAFDENVFWVIFAGAFTPLPYKVFTLIGGFLHVDFFMFVLASFVGRGLRFYAVGFILARFGERVFPLFMRHFNAALLIVGIMIALYATYTVL